MTPSTRARTSEETRVEAGRAWIGTSGWHYDSWWGDFFPADTKKKDALAFYATRFPAAELNGVFYRSPSEAAVTGWRNDTPAGFRFAWKAPQFITHFKRLLCDNYSLGLLESRVALLGEKAGPILFQLPSRMKVDVERLGRFLARLPDTRRYTFEFRDASWYCDAVFTTLGRHDVALCISDHRDAPAPRVVTAGWVYIRNHGPTGSYRDNYSEAQLTAWAQTIDAWCGDGREVWCFFDNDQKAAAPADARRLMEHTTAAVVPGG